MCMSYVVLEYELVLMTNDLGIHCKEHIPLSKRGYAPSFHACVHKYCVSSVAIAAFIAVCGTLMVFSSSLNQ